MCLRWMMVTTRLATSLIECNRPAAVVLFDTLTDEHLATIGRLIWDVQQREQKPLFVAGSSGVEYALVKHWQAAGIAPSRGTCIVASAPRHTIRRRSHGHPLRQLLAGDRPADCLGA